MHASCDWHPCLLGMDLVLRMMTSGSPLFSSCINYLWLRLSFNIKYDLGSNPHLIILLPLHLSFRSKISGLSPTKKLLPLDYGSGNHDAWLLMPHLEIGWEPRFHIHPLIITKGDIICPNIWMALVLGHYTDTRCFYILEMLCNISGSQYEHKDFL